MRAEKRILQIIEEFQAENGYCPSKQAIKERLGWNSTRRLDEVMDRMRQRQMIDWAQSKRDVGSVHIKMGSVHPS